MNLQGERRIPATVEQTWTALNDPETLKACIAGCESIETTGENQYLVLMSVRIGPVNAKFKGRLQLTDIVPLTSYTIQFDGQGGVAGFGKGSASVRLAPEDGGSATRLDYTADAQVGGKIAQIGSRLVESAAGKISDDFFKAFEARMAETAPVAAAANPPVTGTAERVDTVAASSADLDAAPTVPAPSVPAPQPSARGLTPPPAPGSRTWMWVAGLIAVLLAIFLLVD